MSRLTVRNGQVVSSSVGSTILSFDGTIPQGSMSVDIAHNLGVLPTGYSFFAKDAYASLCGLYVSALTSSIITVALVNAQASDVTFKIGVSA